MINKLFTTLLFSASLYSYELPNVEINTDNRPKIEFFKATSAVVKTKNSYKIEWKTVNATDVQLTFIGKVKMSGSIIITEDEYNRGPITITASSRNNSYSDSKTLNMSKNSDVPIVIFKERKQKVEVHQSYNPMPYPRRYDNRYRRRY
ncbi:MAG: hypothetical protein GQ570_03060 [Helicobacteraceae bacterium]|nr:hypothetical protein [Helicobacteraceae bacterium]